MRNLAQASPYPLALMPAQAVATAFRISEMPKCAFCPARRGFVLANVLSSIRSGPRRTQKGLETNVAKNQPHAAPRSTPGLDIN